GAYAETIVEGIVGAEVELMLGDARYGVPRGNTELVLSHDGRVAWIVVEHRMVRAVDHEVGIERGVHEAVVQEPAPGAHLAPEAQLHALAQRIPHVVEEADVRRCAARGLEQDVVLVERTEPAQVPADAERSDAAEPAFDAAGYDLLQGRI